MEKKHSFTFFISLLLLCVSGTLVAQTDFEIARKQPFTTEISTYALDFQDHLYLGFADGSLAKYDPSGALMENFSFPNRSAISLIDVQNNLKPFVFSFDNQEVIILDRFASVPKTYDLYDLGISLASMVCPTPYQEFWVLENNPFTLKKLRPGNRQVLLEVQLSVEEEVMQMQAFQNLLIIASNNYIYGLDQFGNKIYEIKQDSILGFQMRRDTLHVFAQKRWLAFDLFSGKELFSESLPLHQIGAVLTSQGSLIGIDTRKVIYYKPR